MTKHELLKDAEFEAVTEARVDAKHRVGLGKILGGQVTSFRVWRNAHGQIILDPMVSVPAHEAWLFQNPRAMRLVQTGYVMNYALAMLLGAVVMISFLLSR